MRSTTPARKNGRFYLFEAFGQKHPQGNSQNRVLGSDSTLKARSLFGVPEYQHEWPNCDGFHLDASQRPKLPLDRTEQRNVRLASESLILI
jgi:hypothetical protein